MTKKIDEILTSQQMGLKETETSIWFNNYQVDLSTRILNDGNLKSDYLVESFNATNVVSNEGENLDVRRQLTEITSTQS
jgi:hypothetical protein